MRGKVEKTMTKLMISCSNTMLNYRLSKKLKLLGYDKFNYFTNTSNMVNLVLISSNALNEYITLKTGAGV